jgi:hypothetical protein
VQAAKIAQDDTPRELTEAEAAELKSFGAG